MFTGIIREMGKITKKIPQKNGDIILEIQAKKLHFKPGNSVAVNGVCLTAVQQSKTCFTVHVVPETLSRTNLEGILPGTLVNLETSLKVGDLVDGHFVLGHVDKTVKVLKKGKIQYGQGLTLELPKTLLGIVEKGSVTLNGASLTIANVNEKSFTVALIPFTQKHTNLGLLKTGDPVNLEIDVLARYQAEPQRGLFIN